MRVSYKRAVEASRERIELWKAVPDFEGMYEVSNLGRVKSLARTIMRSNGKKQTINERLLRTFTDDQGYARASLSDENHRQHLIQVHQLMMLAFKGPCPEGMQVRHLNGRAKVNKLFNLRYGTFSENQLDRIAHGTDMRGEKHWLAALTNSQVRRIKKKLKSHYKGMCLEIAAEYDVSVGIIRSIKKNKTYRSVEVA